MNFSAKNNGLGAVFATHLFVVAGLLVCSFFPDLRLWGVSSYAYFGWYGRLFLVVVGLVTPAVVWWYSRLPHAERESGPTNDRLYAIVAALILSLFVLAFYIFRARTHFLGDGYLVLAKLQEVTHFVQPWQAGPFLVQQWLYRTLGEITPEGALFVLQFLSVACGAVILLAVAASARFLFSSNRDRLVFLLGMGSGGYMLLFFGYLENYPLFVLSVVLFVLCGLLALRGVIDWWAIGIPSVLAVLFHPFGVVLLPAAIYAMASRTVVGRWFAARGSKIKWIVGSILVVVPVVAFVYLYMTNYVFRLALVPVFLDRFTVDGYHMFSFKHIADYCNLLLQLLPGLPLLLVAGFFLPVREMFRQPIYRFLLLAAVPCLLAAFVIEPKLGMPRDWDLLCFAGVPLAALLFFALADKRAAIRRLGPTGVLAIALCVLLLVPRVTTQVLPSKAIALFDNLSDLDRHRNRSVQDVVFLHFERQGDTAEVERRRAAFREEFPDVAWVEQGIALGKQGEADSAAVLYRKTIEYNPSHSVAWANLGVYFIYLEQYDSALTYMRIANGINPYNWSTYNNLGLAYYANGDTERAERLWLKAIEMNPDNVRARDHLGKLYQAQERVEDYLNLQFEIFELASGDDAPVKYIQMLGDLHLSRADYHSAAEAYRRALEKGLDTAYVRQKQAEHPQLRVID
ncbi:MAG: hypothetical protein DRP45_01535 [Candidatus Zixiibacteriota bacterium]|nr:MAG: hypothetical protein DRP45_01535 [candidate division Zixibacteria bacterium]